MVVMMDKEIEAILKAAGELGAMLQHHDATLRYHHDLSLMEKDLQSQKLLQRLVSMGDELNRKALNKEEIKAAETMENRLIEKELESNVLVKSFIRSQKDYLALVQGIAERIHNPRE